MILDLLLCLVTYYNDFFSMCFFVFLNYTFILSFNYQSIGEIGSVGLSSMNKIVKKTKVEENSNIYLSYNHQLKYQIL